MNVFFIISTLTNLMYIKLEKCLEYSVLGAFIIWPQLQMHII